MWSWYLQANYLASWLQSRQYQSLHFQELDWQRSLFPDWISLCLQSTAEVSPSAHATQILHAALAPPPQPKHKAVWFNLTPRHHPLKISRPNLSFEKILFSLFFFKSDFNPPRKRVSTFFLLFTMWLTASAREDTAKSKFAPQHDCTESLAKYKYPSTRK